MYRISQIVSWPFVNHWSLETKKRLLLSVICGAKAQWLIPLNFYCCLKWRKNKPQWEFWNSALGSVCLLICFEIDFKYSALWLLVLSNKGGQYINIMWLSLVRQSFLYGCSKKIPLTNLITLCLLIYLRFQMRGQWINVYNYFTEKEWGKTRGKQWKNERKLTQGQLNCHNSVTESYTDTTTNQSLDTPSHLIVFLYFHDYFYIVDSHRMHQNYEWTHMS